MLCGISRVSAEIYKIESSYGKERTSAEALSREGTDPASRMSAWLIFSNGPDEGSDSTQESCTVLLLIEVFSIKSVL